MIRTVLNRFVRTARTEGLRAASARAFGAIRRQLIKDPPDSFDLSHGTDTTQIVDLWRLSIPYTNASFGERYQAVEPERFEEAIAHLPRDQRPFTFVDLGCGKGRALIMACEKKFKRIIGVEFSSELLDCARRNLQVVGCSSAELLMGDAADYMFPDEPLVVFLYNPFGATVMKQVLDHLASRSAYLIYVSPLNASMVSARFRLVYTGHAVRIWATEKLLCDPTLITTKVP